MQIRFINGYKKHCNEKSIEGTFKGLNEFYEKNKKRVAEATKIKNLKKL